MNPGDKLLVISIDSSDGREAAASDLTGVEARVERVNDEGTIYLEGHSYPVISGRDVYTITEIG
jgi:hypothetical protein